MKIYLYSGKANVCGENVKKYRTALKLSQTDLAAQLQSIYGIMIEQKSISRIETGDRVVPDYELFALSKVLGVSVYELLDMSNPEANSRS